VGGERAPAQHVGCKTIFATHYHELVQLADELGAVRNYNVGVREVGDQVLFLHRLQPGGADRPLPDLDPVRAVRASRLQPMQNST